MTRRPARRHKPTGPAICKFCGGAFLFVDGCNPDLEPNVATWGSEPWWDRDHPEYLGDQYEPADRCTDCGVKLGHHHHPGCCRSYCARCEGQALGCDCGVGE